MGHAEQRDLPAGELPAQILIRNERRGDGQVVPERSQRFRGAVGISGDDGAVEGANRHPGDHVRADAGLLQRANRAALESAEGATALQDVDGLVGDVAQRVVGIGKACLAGLEVHPVLDQQLGHLRLFGRPSEREQRARHVVPQEERGEGSRLQRSALDPLIAGFELTEQVEAQIEHFAVEIGDFVVRHALAKHVAGRGASLPDGVVPVFDAALAAEDGIEEVGHVAGGKDSGLIRLQEAIDDDAVVHGDAAALQKAGFRYHAGADDHHVAGNGPAALRQHGLDRGLAPDCRRAVADDDVNAMRTVAALEKARNPRHVELPEQFLAFEQGDVDASLPQRGRGLQADEAATDHHGTARRLRTRADGFGIFQRAKIEHAGQRRAGQ